MLALTEMVIQGVSTRKVTEITQELCGAEFSKSTVSGLCKRLDPLVEAWNARPLKETRYPFVIVDAIVIKIREDEQIRPRGVLIATGVTKEGQREILGFHVGDSQSEAGWSELFGRLKLLGLSGVDFVISDNHSGLVRAIQTQFQGVIWQRCQTHFRRNILDGAPKRLRQDLHERVKAVLHAHDMPLARQLLKGIYADFGQTAQKALEVLESGFEDAMAVMALPGVCRQRLRTTNGVERLNEEIRRRERVIRIFPNRASADRLIGAILMEHSEKWVSGKCYLVMEDYWRWRAENGSPSSKLVRIG